MGRIILRTIGPQPLIHSVSPDEFTDEDDVDFVIEGDSLAGATSVKLSGDEVDSFTVDDDEHISVEHGSLDAGTYSVSVTTPYGTATKPGAIEVTSSASPDPVPVLDSLDYAVFGVGGGDTITLTGTDLDDAISVTIDPGGGNETSLSITSNTPTEIKVTTPTIAAGTYDLVVTTSAGTSNALSVEAFDLAGESWTAVWPPPYSGSPWSSSVGVSGLALTGANAPAVGSVLPGGQTPADFDGVDDVLNTTNATASRWSAIVNSSNSTVLALVYADTVLADTANHYDNALIIGGATIATTPALAITSAGARCGVYDGAYKSPAAVACPTGQWVMLEMRWGGGTLALSVDGGTPSTVAVGSVQVDGAALRMGAIRGGSPAKFFDGKVADARIADTHLSDVTIAKVRTALKCRYGL